MKHLLDILGEFKRTHLLVVGDLMLDRFIWGDVERISPEAPVPVLRVASEDFRLGGAANVISNIRSLGGRVSACGVIGRDDAGKRIHGDLRRIGVSTRGVFLDGEFQTIQKTRIIARPRHQQIVRLDREKKNAMAEATLKRLRQFVLARTPGCSGIVISDYGKGVVHGPLLEVIADLVEKRDIICVIDPKKENYRRYRSPSLITPNKEEAGEAAGLDISNNEMLVTAGERLLRLWKAKAVLITRGPDGMSLFRPRVPVKHFPTEPREIFEVTGAGDTVVAVCALALASGANYTEAAVLANLAAGMVGDEVGTVAVPFEKLERTIREKT
jgi:D-beta-D-heptose 7-phosphate kinase/D-beta-D-heptose 1-phosphate adenosyltransferase